MSVPNVLRSYYQSVRETGAAVFGVVGTILYTIIYFTIVPLMSLIAPKRKQIQQTAWTQWTYKADTLEEGKRQY